MALDSTIQAAKYYRPFHERSWIERQWIRVSQKTVGLYFRLLFRLTIEGKEHIPAEGGVLLASNHVSNLDALLIPYVVMQVQGFQIVWSPAKEELFRTPVIGRILLSWGSFPVRRGRGDLRAIRRIVTLLTSEKMMLFPEGTRSRDGQLRAGNRTVGKFIYHARPAVVPTVISGTERIFPAGRWWPRLRQSVTVRFGPPMALDRHYDLPDSKQTSEAIVKEVMQSIAALQQGAGPQAPGSAVSSPQKSE